MKPSCSVSIVIPTYNEKGNVIRLLHVVKRSIPRQYYPYEIIVVDDNSPDGTAQGIRHMFNTDSTVRLFVRTSRPGLGNSIRYGIQKSRGAIIIGMDADGNHDPTVIPLLLKQLKSCDLAVTSRFMSGGGMDNKFRLAGSYLFNLALRYVYGFPILDNTSGFYAVRRHILEHLNPDSIYYGFGEYHLRLVYKAMKAGFRLAEVPVYYGVRISGQSKARLITMIQTYLQTARELMRYS